MLILGYVKLQNEKWTAEVGPTINDPVADNYHIVQANDAICLVMCSSLPYSGWLAKQVSALPPLPVTHIRFNYTMMTDDATTVCAQVAETDFKITDSEGWTYDLSAQWEMAKCTPNWMFQIDNYAWTWTDTGIIIHPSTPYKPRHFAIEARIDEESKHSSVIAVEVDDCRYETPTELWDVPARREGWKPSEIVTQLQQCNNGQPGGYTLRFTHIGYDFK